MGDPGRLRQVVVNLVGNAIKFTPQGEVVVDVSVQEPARTAQSSCSFCVTDTGIGIPPEKLDKVFEAFEQADTSTTRHYGGTGLGLAIVRRLVGADGGRVWVESTVGTGQHVLLHRPAGARADQPQPDRTLPQRSAPAGHAGAGRGRQRHQSADRRGGAHQLGAAARVVRPVRREAHRALARRPSARAGRSSCCCRRQHARERRLCADRADSPRSEPLRT